MRPTRRSSVARPFRAGTLVCTASLVLLAALTISAQQRQAPPARRRPAPAAPGRQAPPTQPRAEGAFDQTSVARGERALMTLCGACHGNNGRGTPRGPDLIRSTMVLEDENGKQLGEFLRVGRPDKGMQKFELPDRQVRDMATFLHERVAAAANRGAYKILDIVTGDPKAGEAYFNGAGGCSTCHSPTGDLKGIGAKYDAVVLQGRMILPPRGGRGRPGAQAPTPAKPVTATVTLASGESFEGVILRLTDFDVTIREADGRTRSWLRHDGAPKVELHDPLKPHMDMLTRWTDTDMHNMTAYLAGLK